MRGRRPRVSTEVCAAIARHGRAACVVLAMLVFPASSLAVPGGIAGEVGEAPGHSPIVGIEACAFALNASPAEEEEGPGEFGCAQTGAGGEYEIDGLNAGSYGVCFSLPLVTTLNFVGDCYDGKAFGQEPTPVSVAEGAITRNIDAELEPGAELEGTVTAAATGIGLEGAYVCAIPHTGGEEEGEPVSCTKSGPGGAFTLAGVPAGTFDLYFFYFGSEEFGDGYLGGRTLAESTTLTVAAREVRTGLSEALVLMHLNAGEGPPGGAEGGAGRAPGAPPGGGTSAARGLSLAAGRIPVGHDGIARVAVVCAGSSACRGRLSLRERRSSRRRGPRLLVLGGVRYSVAPGARTVLALRLDALGRRELRVHHGRLPFRASVIPSSPPPRVVSVKDVVLLAARHGAAGHP